MKDVSYYLNGDVDIFALCVCETFGEEILTFGSEKQDLLNQPHSG